MCPEPSVKTELDFPVQTAIPVLSDQRKNFIKQYIEN